MGTGVSGRQFRARQKGGRGVGKTLRGKGSKIMLVTDGQGIPLSLVIGSAHPHEVRFAVATLAGVRVPQPKGRPRTRPQELVADKAYDSRALRQWLQRRGIRVSIPMVQRRKRKQPKRGRPYRVGPAFRQRWKIERTFAWLQNHQRLVVRRERKPELYRSFCLLAFILLNANRILK
jgi:transposase